MKRTNEISQLHDEKQFRFVRRIITRIIYVGFAFQMTNIDKQHEIVKASLFHFVNTHITAADLSVVDEIVLNYVISILEEATEDPTFDVDGMSNKSILRGSVLSFVRFAPE